MTNRKPGPQDAERVNFNEDDEGILVGQIWLHSRSAEGRCKKVGEMAKDIEKELKRK